MPTLLFYQGEVNILFSSLSKKIYLVFIKKKERYFCYLIFIKRKERHCCADTGNFTELDASTWMEIFYCDALGFVLSLNSACSSTNILQSTLFQHPSHLQSSEHNHSQKQHWQ